MIPTAVSSPRVRFDPVPDGDGSEEHHGGHVVEEGGEKRSDKTQDDDHRPNSSSRQLIRLQRDKSFTFAVYIYNIFQLKIHCNLNTAI